MSTTRDLRRITAFATLSIAAAPGIWGCSGPQPAAMCVAPDGKLPTGVTAAPGAGMDGATGLPTRIVHKASGITLVLIPAGEFLMGSPEGEPGRGKAETRHPRVIDRPFYLGETEVTAAQFRRFVEAAGYSTDAERGVDDGQGARVGSLAAVPEGNRDWHAEATWRNVWPNLPGEPAGDDHPVVHVSWADGATTHAPVGTYRPNPWGLRDITGNVEEWVQDSYARYPERGDQSAAAGESVSKVMRGSSWLDNPDRARSAQRSVFHAHARRDFIGFRVALDAPAQRR